MHNTFKAFKVTKKKKNKRTKKKPTIYHYNEFSFLFILLLGEDNPTAYHLKLFSIK